MISSSPMTGNQAAPGALDCGHLYGWPGSENPGQPVAAQPLAAPNSAPGPRISIVIPTRNQAETLADTLLSILGQNYPDCEIIVVDGGSQDGTLQVLDRFRDHLAAVISEPDRGQSDAINKGFGLASGDIFCWLNSDDYFLPAALRRVAAAFAADPGLRLLVGAGDVISLDHRFLRHIPGLALDEETLLNWRNDRWILQQCCFWSRSLWQEVGGVDERLHLLMDYDLWFRFGRAAPTAVIQDKLAVMRYYPEAKTVRDKFNSHRELAYVYAKNGCLDLLDQHIVGLLADRTQTQEYLDSIDASLPVRLLKRLSLFPARSHPGV